MAQSGFTPIQLYRSSTAAAAPTAGNLADGELAINTTDEKLYFKNAGGTVKLLASSASATGTVSSVALSGGTTGLTVSGSPITTSGTMTLGGTLAVANGGTGTSTAFTAGSVVFAGASGVYTQDNANFFWDDTNNFLGLGTTAPSARLVTVGHNEFSLGLTARASSTQTALLSHPVALLYNSSTAAGNGAGLRYLIADTTGNAQTAGGIGMVATAKTASTVTADMYFYTGATEKMRLTSAGDVGIGTGAPSFKLDVQGNSASTGVVIRSRNNDATAASYAGFSASTGEGVGGSWYSYSGANWFGTTTSHPQLFITNNTERMRITSGGNVGIGTTAPSYKFEVSGQSRSFNTASSFPELQVLAQYTGTAAPVALGQGSDATAYLLNLANANLVFGTNSTARATITTAGYLEATYSDRVVALGNTGTATTINLAQGNVFTATLTGNCTFTLSGSNANASRGSSFTLILTNDGTAGRTVAWSGGSFRFPGGAASLSRTTTANAVDIWVFFTPDNGTTWYGNISMKNMTA